MEVGAEFVVAGGWSAPVLASVEAAFDLVTPLVGGRVERGWSAAVTAFAEPVGDLIARLRDRGGEVFVPQGFAAGP